MDKGLASDIQLFIIGNGFDLAHHLETSYQDFYYYLTRDGASADEQSLFDLLKDKIISCDSEFSEIWSDFEELLGYADFYSDIELPDEYELDRLDDEADKDVDYYDYQVKYLLADKEDLAASLPSIFARWISTINVCEAEAKENFRQLFHDRDEFLTFNYTHTLEKLYSIDLPCYIHGTIDEDGDENGILVGHGMAELPHYVYVDGDRNPLGPLSSIDAIEACVNMSRSMYNAWRKDVAGNLGNHKCFFKRLSNVRTIYSYGFSYGTVDMPYIQAMISHFGEPENVRWLLESYDEEANAVYEERIRQAGFTGEIGRFSV